MTRIEIDMSEVREFAADLRQVDSRLARHVKPVVKRGATNIKDQMVEEMKSSAWFAPVARGISYDLVDDGYTAEIGPTRGPGQVGSLANIAYFGGGVQPGGGTVPDPRGALDAEVPRFQKALADLAEELFPR